VKGHPAKIDVELRTFARSTIEQRKMSPPVTIELMDLGMNVFYKLMTRGKDSGGTWQFEGGPVPGSTGAHPTPWRVRFEEEGKKPFVLDCPFM